MLTPTRRAILAGLGGTLVAGPALAAPRTLTIASLFGEDKPETRIWRHFAKQVDQALPGRFHFNVALNAALGGEKEVAEGARLGSVQGGLCTVSALSAWVAEGQMLDLPFLFADRAQISRALAGPVGQDLANRYTAQGFQPLGFVTYGARHLLARRPVTRTEQLSGQRIRVIQSPLHTELWRGLGANPTPLPITETYSALKTGVVDLMDLTLPAYAGFRLYEVVPEVTETAHIWSIGLMFVSAALWRSLSDADRRVFTQAGRDAVDVFDQAMIAEEAASRELLTGKGVHFHTPDQPVQWRTAAEPVWHRFAPQFGGMAALDKLRSA